MPDAAERTGGHPGQSVTPHAKDSDLMKVLNDVYKTVEASAEFKERLHRRLVVEAAARSGDEC